MKLAESLITTILLFALASSTSIASQLTVLTYHDIVADPDDDAYAISRSEFVAQMDYLQSHGYQPISLSTLNKIIKKQMDLPEKSVLLTFDDGLKSYKNFVEPLLKIYGFPSVLSIVSGWVDGDNTPPEYRNKLLKWDELRALQKLPLTEIISHSHALHTGVQSNPQGNIAAAGVTRIYSSISNSYESESAFRQRIAADLKLGVARFHKELGIKPIAITWPYGRYDNVLSTEAELLGMKIQLTLNDGPNTEDNLRVLNRIMVMRDTHLEDFVSDLKYEPLRYLTHRFIDISLDKFAGQSLSKQEELLSSLLRNIEDSDINTVILSPFTSDGKKAFFPSRHMKVDSDILNRITHQLHNQADVRHIYLRLPKDIVNNKPDEFYTDLARLNWFNGVVFDDHGETAIKKIKKIISYFHPNSRFGYFGKTDNVEGYDFVVLPVEDPGSPESLRDQIQKAKSLPTTLFVYLNVPRSKLSSIPNIEETLRTLGVKHYGINASEEFYSSSKNFAAPNISVNGLLAGFGG